MNIQWMNGCALISPKDKHLDSITVGRWISSALIPQAPCILDLRGGMNVDISGLSLIVKHSRRRDHVCALVIDSQSWVESICDMAQVGELIPVVYTVEDAVAALAELQGEHT